MEKDSDEVFERTVFPTNGPFPGTGTITFGECVEPFVNNKQIGTKRSKEEAYTVEDLLEVSEGIPNSVVYIMECGEERAGLLHIPNGVELFGVNIDDLEEEHMAIINDYDQRVWMRQQQGVVNKKARFNIVIADESHPPDYENKEGTVIAFESVPLISHIRENLHLAFGDKSKGLYAEGNHYFDPSKCGIGWHGDTERTIVVAMRMGSPMNLKYQWFFEGKEVPDGDLELTLNRGDMYIMSYKATGNDWKIRKIPTLRHSAGCHKYSDTDAQKKKAAVLRKISQDTKKLEKEATPKKKPGKTNSLTKKANEKLGVAKKIPTPPKNVDAIPGGGATNLQQRRALPTKAKKSEVIE